MTVIKDCTGSYLRFNDKDYPICNEMMLDGFSNGAIVRANVIKIKECNNDRIHCCMVHPHEMELGGPFEVIWIGK